MVSFRRFILAMSILALFVGLASAQVVIGGTVGTGNAGALSCTASVAVPPQLRAEGMTELIGDIVLACTGGQPLAAGGAIPTANITVSLGTNVTSRLLGNGGSTNASEALLLIDEPGTNLQTAVPGFGPAAPQTVCSSTNIGAGAGGCQEFVNTSGGITVAVGAAGGTTPGPNVFQGIVSGNQVIFNGIPILPPATTGVQRIFRITNIRANAAGLGGGGLAGTTQLLASVAISGSTSLPVNNPVLIAGFIQSGLTTSLRNVNNSDSLTAPALAQCGPGDRAAAGILRYRETFGTAFKTRTVGGTSAPANIGGSGVNQNVPGTIYNSESGFIIPIPGSNTPAGLADYGTRLKAVFNNVPSGVRIFVSTWNVGNTTSGQVANTSTPFAQLVISETAQDSFQQPPVVASTTNSGSIGLAELPVVNGSATAVWEVTATNPAQIETLDFAYFTQFTPAPGATPPSPPAGTATVNQSFAPTPTSAFSASAGGAASSSLTIPRFADTSAAGTAFTVGLCQTVLLYPFVTNQAGFDTGLAIANTSTDPFGTAAQNGTCSLNWYGNTAPTAATTTPTINTGTVYSTLASTAAPGFQGYMLAVCNFQLAHGFAFISDIGARNLAMGYLALVLPNGAAKRNQTNETLDN